MQVQTTTSKTTATATAKATASGSATAFSKAMASQSADAPIVRNARGSGRKMHSILVPKAASTTPTGSTQTATRRLVTAAETEAKYGRGTLATILTRIRQG